VVLYIYFYIYVYVYVYMYTDIYIYLYTNIYLYLHIYSHIYIYTYIHAYICVYVYTRIYVYIYICIYVLCIYIHRSNVSRCNGRSVSKWSQPLICTLCPLSPHTKKEREWTRKSDSACVCVSGICHTLIWHA